MARNELNGDFLKKKAANTPGTGSHIASFNLTGANDGPNSDPEASLAAAVITSGAFRVLRLKDGRNVTLTSAYVPADKVGKLTYIHEANVRSQSSVTAETVTDLIGSVSSGGVIMEVLAVRDENGRYAIFDGQRRRFCALLAGKGLPVAYIKASDASGIAELRELSRIANITLPNSLYDKGQHYARVKNDEGLDQAAVAAAFGVTVPEVHYALQAIEIPLPLYQLLPEGTGTGRPTVLALRKITKSLSEPQLDELLLWAKDQQPYSKRSIALAEIGAEAQALSGGSAEITQPFELISGIEVREEKGNVIKVTLPRGISRQTICDLLATLSSDPQ